MRNIKNIAANEKVAWAVLAEAIDSNFTEHTNSINTKQNKLVSGTNIKTINNESIVGSGNVNIQSGIEDAPADNKLYGRKDNNWEEINLSGDLQEKYAYGVEWDATVSDPKLTRIGNMSLHKTLPVQSKFKGCIAKGGTVVYYLKPDDWTKKQDGSPAKLDGTDGTVRVHTPKFYGKSGVSAEDPNKRWVLISLVKIDDTWVEIPELLIDAFCCTVDRTVSGTPKAVCVVNTTVQFRGGNNNAGYDSYLTTDPTRTHLGKAATNITRSTMRTYAKNAGSELLCYEYYKWIFYWCFVIEYATFNSQAAYNSELTSEGYHQGGLGSGITSFQNWGEYNGQNPLTPCGAGNSIGNFTGIKDVIAKTFNYNRNSIWFSQMATNSNMVISNNGSNNSKVTTQVKAVTDYAFYNLPDYVWGSITYTISGLTDGQKVIFKEKKAGSNYATATVLKEVTEDGEVTIDWSEYNQGGQKYVGFFKTQESCNIQIYNKAVNTHAIPVNQQVLKMPRYRGFDNPFGDIWLNLDGVIIKRDVASQPSDVYTTTNSEDYGDDEAAMNKMTSVGKVVAKDGNISAFNLGETAEIIPSETNGNNSQYMCDNVFGAGGGLDRRTLWVGGGAIWDSSYGLGCFNSSSAVGQSSSNGGFRTLNKKV